MAWTLDSDRPIFLQIVERIQTDIVSCLLYTSDAADD